MHTGLFRCLTKLDAKRAERVQKFVPRSRVGIFRNERTRSTPLDPELSLPRSRVGIFCNERTRSTPLDSKLKILLCFILFGCWDRLVTLQNSVQNVLNWCKSSCHEVASEFFATNAPDPPHWTLNLRFLRVLYYLGAFGTVLLPFRTQCKTGRTSAKVRATKSRRNFSQRTHPIHPIGS